MFFIGRQLNYLKSLPIVGGLLVGSHYLINNQKEAEAKEEIEEASSSSPSLSSSTRKGKKIVIVGGGSGGITVAAQLQRKLKNQLILDDTGKQQQQEEPYYQIEIIEPSKVHYYQPLWTMVGGGLGYSSADSARPTANFIPSRCRWVLDSVTNFDPEANALTLASGRTVDYDYLVVATGIRVNFDAIPGLRQALDEKDGVCTIYDAKYCDGVWAAIQKTREGNAIFTFPSTAVKCGGAPQKIMYLAEHYWRLQGLRDPLTKGEDNRRDLISISYATPTMAMFPVKLYSDALNAHRISLGIHAKFAHQLVEVRGKEKIAVFKNLTPPPPPSTSTTEGGEKPAEPELVELPYSFLHVVPPMGPLPELAASRLVDAAGYVTVDKETLQHVKYPNVFSLGDCSNIPTSKTTAAIASQAPVLVANLLSVSQNQPPSKKYDGYTCCPLLTSRNTAMFAEFGFNGAVDPSFPSFMDPTAHRFPFFLMKKYLFPYAYWNLMLHGYWFGRNHLFNPHG